ncbi:MAG TPA: glycosyltransferase [Thermoleophilaceae bacterium]|nr:glycosyltransferase [Thermoleophilaceae bacterium]
MTPTPTSRADLHCHSTASAKPRLGVQQALGLPECATPPEEVYELAKLRGMDFVTITDHDTIDGALELADRPDTFLSEELTAWFSGEPQAVHVLCWGISPDDHEWLQAHSGDVQACAEYLHAAGIACALAHPFYTVTAPLTPRHRRRLAQLFPVWETRNGSRPPALNLPAAIYIETHGGTGVGGSDDHAGVDVGRTWTETPPASTPEQFVRRIRRGEASAEGDQGSAEKWAHAALALAVRVLGRSAAGAALDPRAVLALAERVVGQGSARTGPVATDLGPEHAGGLLFAWLDALELETDHGRLLEQMQSDDFSHGALFRRARRVHEHRLRDAVDEVVEAAESGHGHGAAAAALFSACVPAVPYVPAIAFRGRETALLARRDTEPARVGLIADGIGATHGVTHTVGVIRDREVPGFQVEVIGTDSNVDRRLPAVADVDIPFYEGLKVGVPSLPAVAETLAEGRYDLIHICSPGPTGVAAALIAWIMGLPVVGSYHTELGAYAGLRSGDPRLRAGVDAALAAFYGRCDVVLSPSESADASLRALGVREASIGRWDRGVDTRHFDPALREPGALPGEVTVLYAGRLTREKGVDLLADAFLLAHERDPRLHLVLAGGGPEQEALAARLGQRGTFLGWLDSERLARAYASADLFLFASTTDTFGQTILEAQASGLPVVSVAAGGPLSLVDDGLTGLLAEPEPEALAGAVSDLAASPVLRHRLAVAARREAERRSWEASLARLADGYGRALSGRGGTEAAGGDLRWAG